MGGNPGFPFESDLINGAVQGGRTQLVFTVFPWTTPPLNNSPSRHWLRKYNSLPRITPRGAHHAHSRPRFWRKKLSFAMPSNEFCPVRSEKMTLKINSPSRITPGGVEKVTPRGVNRGNTVFCFCLLVIYTRLSFLTLTPPPPPSLSLAHSQGIPAQSRLASKSIPLSRAQE